ncbi:glycoside hydrolase family 2 TIM barrel-domain containing protein [uncultured Alistipes sp.]|uniref:glycoside hydrolase family 2 TIM barrel-domain containing protein n=1 Tax=uncultured Alistipes sp. TaxID=538949 RepID=UPI0025EFDB79|nr:glycoside hydrolase family 2 TIM barrel-domain containing protein [uncultured Alistipes sp.]
MKRTILLTAAILCAAGLRAQASYDLPGTSDTQTAPVALEAGRIHRTEVIPFDKRHDAEQRNRAGADACIAFTPEAFAASDEAVAVGQVIDIPYVWTDGVVYLHLENVGTAYTVTVNEHKIAEVEDSSTPAEFALTPYIREGKNAIALTLRRSATDELNAAPSSRKAFDNCYLYAQNKRSIRDFEIALVPDSTRRFGVLELAVVAQNAFNYDEPVTVGYDIYSPQGKLLDFSMNEVIIPGRSTDTIRFSPFIYGTNDNKWEPGAKNPPLYKVMLFTRRDGAYREYMPLKIGFGKTELADGRITRFDMQIKLVKANYNAAADSKTTLTELKSLKAKGTNTICPDYPQPEWFYGLCDELGLYVIDQANINAPEKRDDRTVGGTPSNDPALRDEYLERVRAMYYRSRNHTCVIAFSLGGESGNGYNMYKAYEWLKSVEKSRPVIYQDAEGEWNSDL